MITDTPRPALLILDDEEMVLTSLRSLFRLQTDYEVIVHSSPQQALESARTRPIDLVISDYLMPDMDGITFLGHFKEVQPQAIRVLLTGYADKENAIRAINQVGLYQYIEKPWDNAALLIVVKNGLEKRQLLRTLEQKITELAKVNTDLKSLQTALIKAFL